MGNLAEVNQPTSLKGRVFPEEQSFVSTGTRVTATSSSSQRKRPGPAQAGQQPLTESPSTHLAPRAEQKPAGQTCPKPAQESS